MVQLVALWLIFGADPTAVRFRYDSPSMTNWWARWQKRSKALWPGIGSSKTAIKFFNVSVGSENRRAIIAHDEGISVAAEPVSLGKRGSYFKPHH
jgi:hypothetical protein